MQLPKAPRWLAIAGKGALSRLTGPGPSASNPPGAERIANRFSVEYLASALQAGIANRELLPYYQPILDLDSGELLGFESLARWHHPELGMVSPTLFIPIAEDLDAINDLCLSLLAQACIDARDWPEHLTLSINVSPVQLCDPELPRRLLDVIEAGALSPQRLTIELTEGALVSDMCDARKTLMALRRAGMKLALDDFGAGYTSLRYLNELPFDRIKIDRSFIGTLNSMTGRMIVRSIVTLAQSLHMRVTAEGVESSDQATALAEMGCDHGQGFLFGRAMPAAAALRMVTKRSDTRIRAVG